MIVTRRAARAALGIALALALALALTAPASAATSSPPGRAPGRDPFARASASVARSAKRFPALLATRHDALRRALDRGTLSEAEYALARARSLFHPSAAAARYGDVVAPRRLDATLVLRDLAIRQRALAGAKLERARAILGRPTEGDDDPSGDGYTVPALNACGQHACITWVPTTPDAPAPDDTDGDTIPDWVEQTADVVEEVWDAEVGELGYRPPKDDAASTEHGPDGKLDVYIANLGDDGLYGYCTSDDPNLDAGAAYPYWDLSAYCVVDNDYLEFPLPGLPSLQVTVAHEFFHAVQFAYDAFDDAWFMEGTASWVEDEVYTDVNDNLQYLANSPLRHPEKPLDFRTQNYLGWYGSWIFFRFLEESIADQPDPSIVRDAWEQADGAQGGPDRYSTAAIQAALQQRQWQFRWAFADFGAWNANADATYAEGDAYPSPTLAGKLTVRAVKPDLGPYVLTMDHLTTGYVRLKAGAGVAANAKLRVEVDGPDLARGPEATLVVERANGALSYVAFKLNADGDGAKTVKFGKGTIASVTLVLTNASIRFVCGRNTRYSCQGKPKDDGTKHAFRVSLIQ